MEAVRAVDSLCGDSNLVSFNDTHTHAEVLALFDKAITAEEAKAAPADVPLYVPSAWLPVEVPA
jgi:hypothetical protein